MYIKNGIIREPIYARSATAPKKSTIFPSSEPVNKLHKIYSTTIPTIIHITQSSSFTYK